MLYRWTPARRYIPAPTGSGSDSAGAAGVMRLLWRRTTSSATGRTASGLNVGATAVHRDNPHRQARHGSSKETSPVAQVLPPSCGSFPISSGRLEDWKLPPTVAEGSIANGLTRFVLCPITTSATEYQRLESRAGEVGRRCRPPKRHTTHRRLRYIRTPTTSCSALRGQRTRPMRSRQG